MRALSLWRPWPALIIWAGKRVENRGWTTKYRGPFAIHSGRSWDDDAFDFASDIGWPGAGELDLDLPGDPEAHPTGVVAVADLVDVCSLTVETQRQAPVGQAWCGCGPWAVPGQYHWRLDNIRPLPEAIPCPGKQGWWAVPPAVHAAIDHHLQGVA